MKIKLQLLILIASLPLIALSQNQDTLIIKFRAVPIRNKQKIVLQSNIETIKDIIIKSTGGHYYLKKGSFSRSDSIDIQVNKNNLIIAVSFFYDSTYTYPDQINTFNETLNSTGKEFQFRSKDKAFIATKYEDKLSIFEVVETTIENKKQVYSVLFDRELYVENTNQCYDLKKNENSFELLRRLGIE